MMKSPAMKFLILIATLATAQLIHAQTNTELERRNGFKSIKLGQHIDSVAGTSFKKDGKEKNEYPVKVYEVNDPELERIGEVKVRAVEIKTYKDILYEIRVTTDKDVRLMKGMTKAFGEPKYILVTDSYNWLAPNLSLTFKDVSKNEILLTYRYYPVLKQMQIDKGKKIEEISTDF
jgi:hypothetical protein